MAINPIQIHGDWTEGYVMDKHIISSDYLGDNEYGHPIFDTKRTKLGKLVYELKYNSNKNVINDIMNLITPFLNKWNIKGKVDMILPIPPSNLSRTFQPVFEITYAISDYLNLPTCDNALFKKSTTQSKNLSREDKQKLINGSITFTEHCTKNHNILLIDDLYETGATFNETVRALKTDPLVNNIYVLAMTRTKN
ncbi:MAG: hypothetical protein LKF87_12225 [Clostridium tyrobutyricum]|uniref:ComF family protein n=1 Tax=Clostridium tyrobutyricum TaxID=1519 RepID=UPI002430CD90|nr:hypothetical protein [Clostridium tyrobutyricum]MCH4200555.1 hypothetical protein [Clostridium tyrobutyricum]MCH4237597.1 hypothetical protein [Clostridium tyrobutyricum]MCH4259692.1 hypothetical protein [Clostridium tyrobutyricum]